VLNAGSPVGILKTMNSWPVTIVAIFYILQGLAACYSAVVAATVYGPSVLGGTSVANAVLDGVFGVMWIVAGIGLLARIKACLTVAVVLAALFLSGTSTSLFLIFIHRSDPLAIAANLAYIAIGWVQYSILRSRSTRTLFAIP
jgi:hypothetical protein